MAVLHATRAANAPVDVAERDWTRPGRAAGAVNAAAPAMHAAARVLRSMVGPMETRQLSLKAEVRPFEQV